MPRCLALFALALRTTDMHADTHVKVQEARGNSILVSDTPNKESNLENDKFRNGSSWAASDQGPGDASDWGGHACPSHRAAKRHSEGVLRGDGRHEQPDPWLKKLSIFHSLRANHPVQ